jgi:hypothetical protein
LFLQSHKTIQNEAFPPAADYLTASIQATGNLVVAHAIGRVEDHPGSLNLKIRQRIFGGTPAQLRSFGRRESD